MATINVSDLGGDWQRLLERLKQGEEFTVTSDGAPVAVIAPLHGGERRDPEADLAWMQAFRERNGSLTIEQIIAMKNEGRR
jgi:antitoxin (DNA-binding transcriptional repressor) of toxin-antitoxin stability system